MPIAWSDDLKTGIAIIDYQHQLLFEIIAKLSDAKQKTSTFLEFIIELKIYTSEHFVTEESFMIKYDYPEYSQHKKMHDNFILNYKEKIIPLLEKKSFEIVPELVMFVEEWLVNHYSNEDVKMARYLLTKA